MRMLLMFTFALVTLNTALPSRAATRVLECHFGVNPNPLYGEWRSSKIGGGGYMVNGHFCGKNPDVMYWYTDVGGMFTSEDSGMNWKMLGGGDRNQLHYIRSMSIDPRGSGQIIAAVGWQWEERGGIFVSDDGGCTWTKTLSAQFYGNEALRSKGTVISRSHTDPDTVYVASSLTGFFRSNDNGANWEHLGMENLWVASLLMDSQNPKRLWLSAKEGELYSIHEGKSVKNKLGGGLFFSEDGGENWLKIIDNPPLAIVQCPVAHGDLYGLFDQGFVHKSSDGGVSWREMEADNMIISDNNFSRRFQALAAGSDFILCASTNADFYRLRVGQEKWEAIERIGLHQGQWYGRHQPDKKGWDHFGKSLSSILVSPVNQEHWYFGDWYGIYQTVDGGKNWTLTIDGAELTVVHCLRQHPDDPGRVHLGMADNGYLYSENGGDSYLAPKALSNCKSISVSPAQPNRIYATGSHQGEWQALNVYVSTDYGTSWTPSPGIGLPVEKKPHLNTIFVSPTNPMLVYLTVSGGIEENGGGVYRSEDGGFSWKWDGKGLARNSRMFKEQIWDNGNALAVNNDGSAVVIGELNASLYRRPPEGGEWIKVDSAPNGRLFEIISDPFSPATFYLASSGDGGGVFRSGDAGETWRKMLDKPSLFLAADQIVPGRLAASLDRHEGVMISYDGGGTWAKLDERLPNRRRNPVAFAGDRVVVGSNGNGAFWLPLTEKAAKSVSAQKTASPVSDEVFPTASEFPVPVIPNASFSEGEDKPLHWNLWLGSGELSLSRDSQIKMVGDAALKLSSIKGPAHGSASITIPDSRGLNFTLAGSIKTQASDGELTQWIVAIQVFGNDNRQISWINIASGSGDTNGWQDFSSELKIPNEALRANLVVVIKGEGVIWIDNLQTSR